MSEEKKTYVGPGRESAGAVLIRDLGEGLYGSIWQSEFARDLTPWHPKEKRVTQQMVARWAAGERTVPSWVWTSGAAMIEARVAWLFRLRDRLESVDHGEPE